MKKRVVVGFVLTVVLLSGLAHAQFVTSGVGNSTSSTPYNPNSSTIPATFSSASNPSNSSSASHPSNSSSTTVPHPTISASTSLPSNSSNSSGVVLPPFFRPALPSTYNVFVGDAMTNFTVFAFDETVGQTISIFAWGTLFNHADVSVETFHETSPVSIAFYGVRWTPLPGDSSSNACFEAINSVEQSSTVQCVTFNVITTTTSPSRLPSTQSPSTLLPTTLSASWIKAASPGTTCDFECNALGKTCVASAFSAVTSSSAMLAIATQANFTCPVIYPGASTFTEDPEFDGTNCFYGGGVGTCSAVGDINNFRFCPCSTSSTPTTPKPTTTPNTTTPSTTLPTTTFPTVTPTTITPTTPHPTTTTTTTPIPTTTTVAPTTAPPNPLRSYEFSFLFFDIVFTSNSFTISSSTQHDDTLIPALAGMQGVEFHLSGAVSTVTYSVCDVQHGTCSVHDELACSNVSTGYVPACGSRLFIPLQQADVILRVNADNQVFALSVYQQLVR